MEPGGARVRTYRPGDEEQLVDLFRRVFGKTITPEHWRWKLRNRLVDVENVYVASAGDRPIFQYAGIPVPVHTPDGVVTGMVSVDTMTDPEFQRRGLLTSVGAEVYRDWKNSGVRFIYGVPNPNWGSRAFVLGWRFLLYLRCWIRPLRPLSLLTRRLGLPLPDVQLGFVRNTEIQQVDRADARFDSLWERWIARNPTCISIVRDARWVDWRFLQARHRRYEVYTCSRGRELAGYAVMVMDEDRTAYVPELLSEDDRTARKLIRGIASIARQRTAEKLQVLCVEGSRRERVFWRAGFVVPRERVTVRLVPLADERSIGLYRPLDWEVMGSDFDFQ